jgi:hypothetical protein
MFPHRVTLAIARERERDAETESDARLLIDPDRPAEHVSDDQLRRLPFVDSIVDRVLIDGAPVIAITGAYGEGKTSILNFASERLQKRKLAELNTAYKSWLQSALTTNDECEWHEHVATKGKIAVDFIARHATVIQAGLKPFEPYCLRHSALTRFAESG